ncbi:hypothetical protein SLE2022_015570 [Rubroshorea leprosula]
MSHQSQGPGPSSPAELPTRRKRGRPRKDEGLVQGENTNIPAMSTSDATKKNRQSLGTSNAPSDGMVGQVVSGVIEGSFDAGYLLNVKVADTDTFLRGVVFLPGRFIPITAANDVAPHVKMYQRKEIPIPFLNPQSPCHAAGPLTEKSDKNPVELRNDSPKLVGQVQPTEFLSGISVASVAGENQPSTVKIPPPGILPASYTDLSLGEKVSEQKTVESILEKDKAVGQDQVPQGFSTGLSPGENVLEQKTVESALEKDKAVAQDQVLPVFDTGLSLGEKVSEQKIVESASEDDKAVVQDQVLPVFDTDLSLGEKVSKQKILESESEEGKAVGQVQVMHGFDTDLSLGEKVLEQKIVESASEMDKAVGQNQAVQAFDAGLSLGEKVSGQKTLETLLEKDVTIGQNQLLLQGFETIKQGKGPNIDVELPEEVGLPSIPVNDILPGREASSHEPEVEHQTVSSDLKSDALVSDNAKGSNLELNQIPGFTEPESQVCASTGLNMLMEKQASPRQDQLQDTQLEITKKVIHADYTSHVNGIPLADAARTMKAGTYSAPMTTLPPMIGADHISSEAKPATNDSTDAKMVESQDFSSTIDVNSSCMDCNVNDTIPPAQS